MRDVLYLDRLDQAEVLMKPQRVEVLRQFVEPRSCTEAGERLGQTPQRVYYHVRRLVEAGLMTQVSQRRVRGIHEGVYQASARSYWLSPQVIGTARERHVRDELSRSYLLNLVEEVQAEVARLDPAHTGTPSLGISGEIRLARDRREAFLGDLKTALQELFTRYGGADGEAFRVAVACYPQGGDHE